MSLKHDSIGVAFHFSFHQMVSQQIYAEFELSYEIPERRTFCRYTEVTEHTFK